MALTLCEVQIPCQMNSIMTMHYMQSHDVIQNKILNTMHKLDDLYVPSHTAKYFGFP
jgi:hypothetical protein